MESESITEKEPWLATERESEIIIKFSQVNWDDADVTKRYWSWNWSGDDTVWQEESSFRPTLYS